ncbi:unnamed protein product [Rotaria sp. Silwood2]|nr:unnamed protein product [Rotaria sp. Silwood2]CAF3877749.1 unnamed protein product [Rotaria sp. Silwood2]CAF4023754.1 unnamed protein product [Rotaria sp. Silwood2]
MIFSSKRSNTRRRTPSVEACVSILGLFVAIGLIGGVAALIYVKGSLTGTIGGGIVFGVSAIFSIILVLVVKGCLKNNNVDSNTNETHSSADEHQFKRNRQVEHEQVSSHEITVISEMHKYDQQQRQHPYDTNTRSQLVYTDRLTDSTNQGYGKQIQNSSTKVSSIDYLNQSNHSINHQNHKSSMDSDKK